MQRVLLVWKLENCVIWSRTVYSGEMDKTEGEKEEAVKVSLGNSDPVGTQNRHLGHMCFSYQ